MSGLNSLFSFTSPAVKKLLGWKQASVSKSSIWYKMQYLVCVKIFFLVSSVYCSWLQLTLCFTYTVGVNIVLPSEVDSIKKLLYLKPSFCGFICNLLMLNEPQIANLLTPQLEDIASKLYNLYLIICWDSNMQNLTLHLQKKCDYFQF